MSYTVTHTITAEDFRQNYTPDPEYVESRRHWMLDMDAGRDLLSTALRKSNPHVWVPFFKKDLGLDPQLNVMIERLGLRDMPQPQNSKDELAAMAKFFMMMLRVQFGRIEI